MKPLQKSALAYEHRAYLLQASVRIIGPQFLCLRWGRFLQIRIVCSVLRKVFGRAAARLDLLRLLLDAGEFNCTDVCFGVEQGVEGDLAHFVERDDLNEPQVLPLAQRVPLDDYFVLLVVDWLDIRKDQSSSEHGLQLHEQWLPLVGKLAFNVLSALAALLSAQVVNHRLSDHDECRQKSNEAFSIFW